MTETTAPATSNAEPEPQQPNPPQLTESEAAACRYYGEFFSERVAGFDEKLQDDEKLKEACDNAAAGLAGLDIADVMPKIYETFHALTLKSLKETREAAKLYHTIGNPDVPFEERQRLYQQLIAGNEDQQPLT